MDRSNGFPGSSHRNFVVNAHVHLFSKGRGEDHKGKKNQITAAPFFWDKKITMPEEMCGSTTETRAVQ
jgi:hypothetical protein